jgi:CubicO group peptidase (beta-lactamase class C family)
MIPIFYRLCGIFASQLYVFTDFCNGPGGKTKFRSFLSFSLLITAISFIASCQSSTQKTKSALAKYTDSSIIELPKPLPLAKAEYERLNNACQLWYDSALLLRGFNGGILVAKNGNIVFEKYNGTGHLPGNDFITDSTPLQIASISKTFTAMAVLKLWQDGKLNIDDELSKYLTTFNYPGVTIRTLLNHRSGLPNYLYFMEKLGWNEKKTATNENVLNYLMEKKAAIENIGPPDKHFSYCNTNYALLALLIEKVSGKKFGEFLRQTFFTPLQMKNSFVYTGTDSAKVNLSYDWKGRLIPLNYLDAVYGDKNIYTTPQDLLIWDRALSSDKIFTAETLLQAYTPYSNEKPGIKNYGLGWRMNIYPDGKKMIFHNGWWHGTNATFIRLLKENATIIVVGNKFTRNIYHAKILCNLFGDYYTPEDDEENDNIKPTDSLTALNNSTVLPMPRLSKKDAKLQQIFKDKNKVKTQ